jgi:O-6-methylguanine DNA methyltransferase
MHLRVERRSSPLGTILLVSDREHALRALDFADYEARMLQLLRAHYGSVGLEEAPVASHLSRALDAYFQGQLGALEHVPVATGGTAFQRQVWRHLRGIPLGSTLSYGALAARMGRPGSARAVGLANAANPVGIVVPCHRVIGASGALTGYAGGVARKRWLLEHEGLSLPATRATGGAVAAAH